MKSLLPRRAAPEEPRPPPPPGEVLYAVGDIHGRVDLLDRLLTLIRQDMATDAQPARLVLLGDLIDRGPSSREVVARAIELQAEMGERFTCLKGNHEAMLLGFLEETSAGSSWATHGGFETMRSYLGDFCLPRGRQDWTDLAGRLREAVSCNSHLGFLEALPSMALWGSYVFVHAGVRPGTPLNDQREEDLLWIREPFLSFRGKRAYTVIHGHSPTCGKPTDSNFRVGVDTGAYLTNILTAVRLGDNKRSFLQTPVELGLTHDPVPMLRT